MSLVCVNNADMYVKNSKNLKNSGNIQKATSASTITTTTCTSANIGNHQSFNFNSNNHNNSNSPGCNAGGGGGDGGGGGNVSHHLHKNLSRKSLKNHLPSSTTTNHKYRRQDVSSKLSRSKESGADNNLITNGHGSRSGNNKKSSHNMSHHSNSSNKIKRKISSSSVRVHQQQSHHNQHYNNNRIVKNSEKYSKAKAVLEKAKIVKRLNNESYKIPKNSSNTSNTSSSTTVISSPSLRGSSKSSSSLQSKESSSSLAKSSLRKDSSHGKTPSSSSKLVSGPSDAFIKAKQFLEQNEKLYPDLKLAVAMKNQDDHSSIDYLKTHFNSTQWSLENHLADLVRQESELKSEMEAFRRWYKDASSTRSRNRKSTPTTFQAFHNYYEKLRRTQVQKIRDGGNTTGNDTGTSNCLRSNGTSIERRIYYQEKLNVKNHVNLFPVSSTSTASLVNGHDKNLDVSRGRVSIKVEPSEDDCSEDGSTNWELVSLEHAFNAFPETYQTTMPKVKSVKIENDYDDSASNNNLDVNTMTTYDVGNNQTEKSSIIGQQKTTKKSLRKIRKTKNHRQTAAPKQSAIAENNNNVTSQSDQNNESLTLFSPDIWQKFQTFVMRVAFAIHQRNYEPLQCYIKSVIHIPLFIEQMQRERRQVLKAIEKIEYQQAPSSEASTDESENQPTLPAKRLRRNSYKSMVDYDCLVSAANRRNRVANSSNSSSSSPSNSRTVTTVPAVQCSSKSPSPVTMISTRGKKSSSIPSGPFYCGNIQTDMPLMTRTQSRYFFENVISADNNSGQSSNTAPLKDLNDVKNHLSKLLLSMDSLQDLAVDIKERQPILQLLKVFKEFFDFKFRPPKNGLASGSASSPGTSHHRSRSFNSRRRRKRTKKQIVPSSSHKTSEEDGNVVDSPIPSCHGLECSRKFDMPVFDHRLMLTAPPKTGQTADEETREETPEQPVTAIDQNVDGPANTVQYCQQTLDFINQTEALYKAPVSFFGPKTPPIFNAFAGPSVCSKLRNKTTTRIGSSGGGSRCEMKLRSRSSSSSSSFPESTMVIGDDGDFPLFAVDNSRIFDHYVDIGEPEAEDPEVTEVIPEISKKKRSRKRPSSAADDSTKTIQDDDSNHPETTETDFCNSIIDSVVDPMSKLVWSMSHSKLKQLFDMSKEDHKLEQAEKELQKLDFQIIDLYHQYLHKEKKFSDQELTECLEKLENHAIMNEEWQRKTLKLMAMAPNSQQMCWAFSERSALIAMMEQDNKPLRSISRDRFDSVMESMRGHLPQEQYRDLIKMANDIDWIRLDQPTSTADMMMNVPDTANRYSSSSVLSLSPKTEEE